MIICRACGSRNEESESFCGECGAYLEWEGERISPAIEPDPPVAPEPPPANAPGFVQRVKTAVGLGDEPEPRSPAGPPPGPSPGPPPGPPPSAPLLSAPPPPLPDGPPGPAGAPAAGLVVPLAPAAPSDYAAPPPGTQAPPPTGPADPAAAPVAVRPGRAAPKAPRRDLPPEERRPAPGETICGGCGAGNAPARKFCRRCGVDLADAPIARQPGWWRRILRRRRTAPTAGHRPKVKVRRSHRGLWGTLLVVVALVVAGLLTRSLWSPAANQVLDRVNGTKTVNPTTFAASSTASAHNPKNVRDGAPNVFWAPSARRRPVGQYVQAGFDAPFRLVYLRVFNGASDQLKDYLAESSARKITVTLTREGSGPVVKTFTLTDKPGKQDLHIAVSDVTSVRVTIESVYRPASARLVALGELEFLARK